MTELQRLTARLQGCSNFGGFPGSEPLSAERLAAMVNRALDEPQADQLSGHGPFTPIKVTAGTEGKERAK